MLGSWRSTGVTHDSLCLASEVHTLRVMPIVIVRKMQAKAPACVWDVDADYREFFGGFFVAMATVEIALKIIPRRLEVGLDS